MVRTADQWFEEYSASHQNPLNKTIHWICIPLIVISVVGLLRALPLPGDWGLFALVLACLYYFRLSISLAVGMILVSVAVLLLVEGLGRLPVALWLSSAVVFVVAWIGQFIGHRFEGKKPSFFKDLQFLLIGPLWLLGHAYRKAGIRY